MLFLVGVSKMSQPLRTIRGKTLSLGSGIALIVATTATTAMGAGVNVGVGGSLGGSNLGASVSVGGPSGVAASGTASVGASNGVSSAASIAARGSANIGISVGGSGGVTSNISASAVGAAGINAGASAVSGASGTSAGAGASLGGSTGVTASTGVAAGSGVTAGAAGGTIGSIGADARLGEFANGPTPPNPATAPSTSAAAPNGGILTTRTDGSFLDGSTDPTGLPIQPQNQATDCPPQSCTLYHQLFNALKDAGLVGNRRISLDLLRKRCISVTATPNEFDTILVKLCRAAARLSPVREWRRPVAESSPHGLRRRLE